MSGIKGSIKPILRVRGLHKYFGDHHVIKGVNLNVRPGEIVVIMGPSGAGKSTFLRCLNFLEEPSNGFIEISGVEINAEEMTGQRDKRIREIRRKAGMVFQEFNLFPHMTVLNNIIQGAVRVKGVPKKQAVAKAEELLVGMGLLAKRNEFPSRLAAGEQQQVAIARSLCMEPQIMLFDDPTSALDPTLVIQLGEVMVRLAHEGIAQLVVTNEPYLARKVANRVVLMDNGGWVEIAPPEKLFFHPEKKRTRQFLARISLKDIRGGT
jgi:ABC-type polar amino acid transport system ATPase subunit